MSFDAPYILCYPFWCIQLESYEEDCEGDYLHNYSMLLGSSDQQAAEQNQLNQEREEPANGSAEHQVGITSFLVHAWSLGQKGVGAG